MQMTKVMLFVLVLFSLCTTARAQKGCAISAEEVHQFFNSQDQISAVPGDPCKFTFFDPTAVRVRARYALEIRPQEATGVSNEQFAERLAALKAHYERCETMLNLGARAAFCQGKEDKLLILHGGILSVLATTREGPNGNRYQLPELAKVVFDVRPESAPLEKPKD